MAGGRYTSEIDGLIAAVLNGPGQTATGLRRAAADRASSAAGASTGRSSSTLPQDLAVLVDTAASGAYRITDQNLQALEKAGYTDDQLFEVAIAAALGAALGRLEVGLKALQGVRS